MDRARVIHNIYKGLKPFYFIFDTSQRCEQSVTRNFRKYHFTSYSNEFFDRNNRLKKSYTHNTKHLILTCDKIRSGCAKSSETKLVEDFLLGRNRYT